MKIAVATEDGKSISRHFGRTRSFLVFEVVDQQIIDRAVRENSHTAYARGECHEETQHNHHHGHGEIVAALRDCEAVLCLGMGWRAAADLTQNGIRPFVLAGEMSPEEAVRAYLAGSLEPAGGFCRCHESSD